MHIVCCQTQGVFHTCQLFSSLPALRCWPQWGQMLSCTFSQSHSPLCTLYSTLHRGTQRICWLTNWIDHMLQNSNFLFPYTWSTQLILRVYKSPSYKFTSLAKLHVISLLWWNFPCTLYRLLIFNCYSSYLCIWTKSLIRIHSSSVPNQGLFSTWNSLFSILCP